MEYNSYLKMSLTQFSFSFDWSSYHFQELLIKMKGVKM